jgi:hypothetical protein
MKKIDITKRDIKCFCFGVIVMFLIEMIFNWKDVKQGFNEGYNKAMKETAK